MRPFADTLRDIDAGAFYERLSAQLSELVEAVILERKPGDMTIKLKVRPNGETSIMVSSDSKVNIPQRPIAPTIMFVSAGGILSRNDPRQQELPLRAVPKIEDAPLREAK